MKILVCYDDGPYKGTHRTIRMTLPKSFTQTSKTIEVLQQFVKSYNATNTVKLNIDELYLALLVASEDRKNNNYATSPTTTTGSSTDSGPLLPHATMYTPIPLDAIIATQIEDRIKIYVRHQRLHNSTVGIVSSSETTAAVQGQGHGQGNLQEREQPEEDLIPTEPVETAPALTVQSDTHTLKSNENIGKPSGNEFNTSAYTLFTEREGYIFGANKSCIESKSLLLYTNDTINEESIEKNSSNHDVERLDIAYNIARSSGNTNVEIKEKLLSDGKKDAIKIELDVPEGATSSSTREFILVKNPSGFDNDYDEVVEGSTKSETKTKTKTKTKTTTTTALEQKDDCTLMKQTDSFGCVFVHAFYAACRAME